MSMGYRYPLTLLSPRRGEGRVRGGWRARQSDVSGLRLQPELEAGQDRQEHQAAQQRQSEGLGDELGLRVSIGRKRGTYT